MDRLHRFQAVVESVQGAAPSLSAGDVDALLADSGIAEPELQIGILNNLIRSIPEPALAERLARLIAASPRWELHLQKLLCDALPVKPVLEVVADVLGTRKVQHVLTELESYGDACFVFDGFLAEGTLRFDAPGAFAAGDAVLALNYEAPLVGWVKGTVRHADAGTVDIEITSTQHFPKDRKIAPPLVIFTGVSWQAAGSKISKLSMKIRGR